MSPLDRPLYSSEKPQLVHETTRNRRFWTSKNFERPVPDVAMSSTSVSVWPHFGQPRSVSVVVLMSDPRFDRRLLAGYGRTNDRSTVVEIFFLLFVVSVLGPFALYWFIYRETANPEIVDRETAEREARELGGTGGSRGRRPGRSGRREPSRRTDGRDRDDEL